MKRRLALSIVCAALAVGVLAAAACAPLARTHAWVVSGTPSVGSADDIDGRLSRAINDFGIDLVSSAGNAPSDNTIVSPASIHAVLSMTANGAEGQTAEQMRSVLHVDTMTPADANLAWATLLRHLAKPDSPQRLEFANSLWLREGIPFKDSFVDTDRDYFGAQVSTLDFEHANVAGAINRWVSRSTHGGIKKIVRGVPTDAVLYLANAVFFESDWQDPFKHEGTQKQRFTTGDGSKTSVDMMRRVDELPYTQNATVQATRLAYKGGSSDFYVLLPKQGVTVGEALADLRGTGFSALRGAMRSTGATEVILGLPKLDTEFSASLKRPLSRLGMPRAFDRDSAEFGGVAKVDTPVWIGDVAHKTKIKVDEKGTVAAAATIARKGATARAQVPPQLICDRPYIFAIVDRASGAMLFLGVVNDPTQ